MTSPQMQNLLDRYGVDTEAELLQAIADDLTENCCDPAEHMDGVLDQMLEAEYQRIAGGAYDPEYELTGWNAEMAAAERSAEEQAFWEGL
jgi:hypothetical protein